MGFDLPHNKDAPEFSPKSDFVGEVMGIQGADGTPHFDRVMTVTMNSKLFIDAGRPRLPRRNPVELAVGP
jgi:hypothetical protein